MNPQYPHPALSFFILAAVMQTLSMCYLATLALAGDKLLAKLRHKRNLAALGAAAVGLLFCLFAVKLWQSVFLLDISLAHGLPASCLSSAPALRQPA